MTFVLHVTPARGSTPGTLGAPDLTQAPQLSLEQWESRASEGKDELVWGCVRGDVGQWSPDATELAQGKLVELSASTLTRMGAGASLHVTATDGDGRVLEQSLASDGTARARTFVAFTNSPARAHACLVVCSDVSRCGAAVESARIDGDVVSPPSPGLALRGLSATVHHPHAALGVVATLIVLVAVLAVATRPRPSRQGVREGKKPKVATR